MGLFFKKSIWRGTMLGVWKITEPYDELLSLLPDKGEMYSDRLNSFKSEKRKMESLAVRVLLFTLLKEEKPISYLSSGKPYFPDASAFLSMTHTKGYAAVIVSKTREVGIDIERRSNRVARIAHKFVGENEEWQSDSTDRNTRLTMIWAAKEVAFKCMDKSDIDFIGHLKLRFNANDKPALSVREKRTPANRRFDIGYRVFDDFVLAWAVV